MGEAVIVAGVGCRRGASAAEIEAAIMAALARADLASSRLDALATVELKAAEAGIAAAAQARGIPLVLVAQRDLERAGGLVTHSRRIVGLMGVGSVAEAAALAAGGAGARLIVPRVVVGAATCALAYVPEKHALAEAGVETGFPTKLAPAKAGEHAPMQNKPSAGEAP